MLASPPLAVRPRAGRCRDVRAPLQASQEADAFGGVLPRINHHRRGGKDVEPGGGGCFFF